MQYTQWLLREAAFLEGNADRPADQMPAVLDAREDAVAALFQMDAAIALVDTPLLELVGRAPHWNVVDPNVTAVV